MLSRNDSLYLPGHGPLLPNPAPDVANLFNRRVEREEAIFEALRSGPSNAWNLMDRLYSKTDPRLRRAAERDVIAHLEKLHAEGRVAQAGEIWSVPR